MPRVTPIRLRPFSSAAKPHLKFVLPIPKALVPVTGCARKYFRTKREGEGYVQTLLTTREKWGTKSLEMPEDERVAAVRAADLLRPYGWTLTQAAEFAVVHLKATSQACSVRDLMPRYAAFLKATGKDAAHVLAATRKTKRFAECFGDYAVCDVTTRMVAMWLRVQSTLEQEVDGTPIPKTWLPGQSLAAETVNGFRRYLRGAFGYARRQGHLTTNPVDDTDPVSTRGRRVAVLAPETMQALLDHAPEDLLPYLAIGAFAGLRPSEIIRLKWSDLKMGRTPAIIDVDSDDPRSYARRWVTIPDNLKEWLQSYKNEKWLVCRLTETQIKKRRYKLMAKIGLDVWPMDCLRHSYASYHLAEFNDLPKLMAEMGHSDPKMIKNHYRERVEPAAAHAWWAISPGNTDSRNLAPFPQ